MQDIQVVTVDPFSPETAYLLPELYNRVFDLAAERFSASKAEEFTRKLFARLCLGDVAIRLFAVLSFGSKKRCVVGHAIGEIMLRDDETKEVFVWQCAADPGYPKVVDKLIGMGDTWGCIMQATHFRLESTRVKNLKAFARRYGLRPISIEMERSINGQQKK